ncbi:MAG: flagellar hook-associated protein FlgK [Oscillospiraceae bacterium]|nr:flagellar hook-associated protein FlgK [Oscillospiraceae bacterium]
MLRPTFLGFETQKRALFSAQKALDVTGSNIGNVDTVGYTRQRVDLFSVENFQGGLRYNTKIALAGQGVDMRGVTQVRDVLLDERYRTVSGEANESTTKADILYQVEDVIDDIEADTTGFNAVLSKLEAALQSFSTANADRREMATIAINSADKITQIFQNFSKRIDDVSSLTFTKTENAVDRINQIFKQIASLNKQIVDDYVASNETYIDDDGTYKSNITYGPLELKDQRNLLLDELAEYGNVEVTTNPLGDITVKFGDTVVVDRVYYDTNGNKVTLDANGNVPAGVKATANYVFGKLSMFDPSSTNAAEKAPSNLKLYASEMFTAEEWVNISCDPAKLDSVLGPTGSNEIMMVGSDERNLTGYGLSTGSLKGLFDMYNGNGGFVASSEYTGECKNGYAGIPYYKEVVNSLAKVVCEKFNEANGYAVDANGNGNGRRMFEITDPANPAFSFRVSDDWRKDTMMITRTPEQKDDEGKTGEELDNENLHRLLAVFQGEFKYDSIPSGQTYTLSGYVRKYGEDIGEQTQFEYDSAKANTTILESVGAARDRVMGVSLDEEGINMMNFQKWYNAAARMMTTLDEALNVIINQMGLVGRG